MPQVKNSVKRKTLSRQLCKACCPTARVLGDGGAVANKVSGINIQLPLDCERAVQGASHLSEEMTDVSQVYLSPFLSLQIKDR